MDKGMGEMVELSYNLKLKEKVFTFKMNTAALIIVNHALHWISRKCFPFSQHLYPFYLHVPTFQI